MCNEAGSFIQKNGRRAIETVRVYLQAILLFTIGIILIPEYCLGDVSVPSSVAATDIDAAQTNTISLDTKGADIRDILLGLARDNGINLIMDESVEGSLSISLSDVSPMEAIGLILHTNGFAVERVGDMIVAGTVEQLRNALPPLSKIIALQNASASELKASLDAIAPGRVSIQADVRTNSLVITGTTSGLHAVEQAIELLDVEVESIPRTRPVMKVFPLKHAQASAIQAIAPDLCSPLGKTLVDERTNSLIVVDEIAIVEQLAEAIKQLDVPSPFGGEEDKTAVELYTKVFRLNYIDANALKETLQGMLSPAGNTQAFVRQKRSLTPVQPAYMGVTADEQRDTSKSAREPVTEKWSDVLIVTDTADVMERIDDLINRLDTRIPQVMIEARMVELNLSDIVNIGIDWQAKHSPSRSTVGVEMPSNKTDGIDLQIGTLSIQRFEDIMLRIQALETNGQARLISNPSIIALDNELAQMVVADRIPVPTTYETEFSATRSYEFINVGIILTVVPHITEDGYVLMDAMPEVNSIKEWTLGENPQPIISSRMARTRVRVKDGQTFVIGGLIKDEQRETVSRVPVLHAVPFIGRLFKSKGTDNVKTDLVVFITPRVCKDDT